jgi:hypothetical protein
MQSQGFLVALRLGFSQTGKQGRMPSAAAVQVTHHAFRPSPLQRHTLRCVFTLTTL